MTFTGSAITFAVYCSLGFKQMESYEEEEEEVEDGQKSVKRQTSNLNPDDRRSKKGEIFCVAFRRQGKFD